MNLLKHEEEGFIYQIDAPYMLSFYIKKVFALQEKVSDIGKSAKSHAEKTHSKQINLSTLLSIYNDILSMNNSG